MAITTVDGAIAGAKAPNFFVRSATGTLVAGRAHNPHYQAGFPGAMAAPSPGLAGEQLTSMSGSLPFSNPVSGNSYLYKFTGMATQGGLLLIFDRLAHYSGLDPASTSKQTLTNAVQIPARDINGSNAGVGVMAAVEISSAVGAGTPTLTLEYTNSAGTAGQTGTNIVSTAASAIAGSFYMIGLAAGDVGVQKATALTLSGTWTSGSICVVLYRVIAALELTGAYVPNALDFMALGLPQMWNNTVPQLLFIPNTTTTSIITGSFTVAQG